MRVIVLGGGVIGTATSWYLAERGHEVTVLERRDGVGVETSFANGGQVWASTASPWASPSTLTKVLRNHGKPGAPFIFNWKRWDPALWEWGLRFLANCTSASHARHSERMLRIASYSLRCLRELRDSTGLQYTFNAGGILRIYWDPEGFEASSRSAEQLSRQGYACAILSPEQCTVLEPTLAHAKGELVGGLHTPADESGDAHEFTCNLAKLAESMGVTFKASTTVLALERTGDRISGVVSNEGRLAADCYVLAAGSFSPQLARTVGMRLPIIPVKGYSVTIPVKGEGIAPTTAISDSENRIVCTRLGDRLRVAGIAEFSGWDDGLDEQRWRMVLERGRSLFPNAGDWSNALPWAGLRPVTPDGPPIIGATPIKNLWLNTGHGVSGWTMACGSGRLISDLIDGRKPEIATVGVGLDRNQMS